MASSNLPYDDKGEKYERHYDMASSNIPYDDKEDKYERNYDMASSNLSYDDKEDKYERNYDMASSNLSYDDNGDKHMRTYDNEIFLPAKENEIRMILIGRTGSGISASGNSILKQVCFHSLASGPPVTKTCCIKSTKRDGKIFKIVDTPGLFGNILTVDEIKREIPHCFTLVSPGPHVIVYVLRIGRFTEEEIQGVNKFLQIFGGNPLQYTIILFTGADDLHWNETSNENYLNNAPIYLKKLVKACSRRCVFFNNRLSNSLQSDLQLDEFFKTVEKMLKENQNEMPYYTNKTCKQIEDDFKPKHKNGVCSRFLTQMKRGGVAFATGLFFLGMTGETLFSLLVGIGTGIGAVSYFKDVKETNDTLSKVFDQITDDSTCTCAIS